MKRILSPSSILVLLICLLTGPVQAQDLGLSSSQQGALRAITTALVTLSSDDNLAAGTYKFKDDGPDADLDLLKYDGEFSIGDPDAQFLPLFEVSPAYLELEQDNLENSITAQVRSWSLGIGTGLRMKFLDGNLELTPRVKAEYSQVDYDFASPTTDTTNINETIPDFDVWSIIPSIETQYVDHIKNEGTKLGARSHLSFVYNDADPDNSNFESFSQQSWLWRNTMFLEQAVSINNSNNLVYLRPTISRVDIHGAARNGFEFNNFYEFGVDVTSQELATNWFKEVGVGVTYVYEREVQGWLIGIIASLA